MIDKFQVEADDSVAADVLSADYRDDIEVVPLASNPQKCTWLDVE